MARGNYEQMVGTWVAQAATATGKWLVVVMDGGMYWINPESSKWGQLESSWDTVTMTGYEGSVYTWERSNTVYQMDVQTNVWRQLTGTYGAPVASTWLYEKAYVVEGTALYNLNRQSAQYGIFNGSWDVTQIVGHGDSIYTFDRGGALYRMRPATNTWTQLDGSWPNTRAAVSHAGRIYAVNNGALYDIDPETGRWQMIDGSWSTTHLASCLGKLYSFEASGALYRIAV
ncbi:MAG: hypothetical protein WKG01_41685 [Kofleriaceae bacterium]